MILKTTKTLLGASVLAIATTGAAQAATFTFGGAAPTGTTESYSAGGFSLDVTASGGNITRFSNDAIGVGPNSTFSGTQAAALMSIGESLQFVFSPSVQLLSSLVFESKTGTDTVKVTNQTNGSMMSFSVTNGGTNSQGTNGVKEFTIDFAAIDPNFNAYGSSFLFETTGATGQHKGVAIKSISVAPVPVPASLPLLAAGLGGMAIATRRKAKKA